jgi:hypothetical protein
MVIVDFERPYRYQTAPTLLPMQGGREIARISGVMDTPKIIAWTMAGIVRS